MQGIVDACVGAAESSGQNRDESTRQQLLAELRVGKCSPNRYPAIAAILERDARAAGVYERFAPLIRQLGDPGCPLHAQPHAAVALSHVWDKLDKRDLIAELEKGDFQVGLFDKAAEAIEIAAKEQKASHRYRRLCLHLRNREVGQRVEERAAKALRELWGVS